MTPKRQGAAAARAPVGGAPVRALAGPAWLGPLAVALAFGALLWACRGFTLGAAVADDYAFLFRQRFQHPLDPFDSMGATYYWRPLSRQLTFGLLGGALPGAPWAACLINALLLLATAALGYRVARRWLTPALAAPIAVIPLLSEPARALLTWPSGVQHLLAGAWAALAVHEAVAGRRVTAALAGLAGLLSHESALFVLLMLPAIDWWRRRAGDRERRTWFPRMSLALVAGVLVAWAAGYAIARGHGVVIPPRPEGFLPVSRIPELAGRAFRAGFNLEDLGAGVAGPATVLLAALGLVTVGFLASAGARRRLRELTPAILIALAVFVLGSLPLAWLLPDWNAWRAWIPTLALMVALVLACAAATPWLAVGLTGMRLALMLLATPGPATVSPDVPETASDMSFVRIVRLQRIVESARRSLLAAYPTLPHGAAVRYWELPRLAEVGFLDRTALQVWYGDTTLVWSKFGGVANIDQPVDALLEFTESQAVPGYVLEPEAVRLYLAAWRAQFARRLNEADSLFVLAQRATRTRWALAYGIRNNRARIALAQDRPEQARTLLEEYAALKGRDAGYWAVSAWVEYRNGNFDAALAQVQQCLALDPRNPDAMRLAEELQRLRR